jgi:flagellar motor switch protein FliM
MAERQSTKPEIASQKRLIKLPPAVGDWTTYRPPKVLVKKVKTGLYGFDRLSKVELNDALFVHYRFVQEFLKRLKIDLGMGVEFLSCQIEQATYLNFLRSLTGPLVQGKINTPSLHESIQLYFDLGLANSIIDHALGSREFEPLNRKLTEAEITTFITALEEYLPHYLHAFENALSNPTLAFVSSPDVTLDPSVNTASTFVFFSAEVVLNDTVPGTIIFGYPGGSLKSLLRAFEEKKEEKPLDFSRLPASILSKILVPASAILGKTTLYTSELDLLEVGDVVSLESLINSAVALFVGGKLKFPVQPGIFNKKKAVRIAGFKEEEEVQIAPPPLETIEKEKPVKREAPAAPTPPPKEQELPPEEKIFEEEEEFPEEDLFEEEELEEEFPEEEKGV